MKSTPQLSRLQELLPNLFEEVVLEGKPYLQCLVDSSQQALIPMEYVQESLLLPSTQITPIPNMHPTVLGIMASRSRVFFAIDLARLLGISQSTIVSRRFQVVVVRIAKQSKSGDEQLLALVVDRIQNTLRSKAESLIPSLDGIPSQMHSLVQGTLQNENTHFPVLDINAFANIPELISRF